MDQNKLHWKFVGECGLDGKKRAPEPEEEYLFRLSLGIAYLRLAFGEPPEGVVLDVLITEYQGIEFPIIAIGFAPTNEDKKGLQDYADHLSQELEVFDQAIDWSKLRRRHQQAG